jgi:phytoene/squalene synthetase
MIELNIPGRGRVQLQHLVCDVNGTLAVDGQLLEGAKQRLAALRDRLILHLFGRTAPEQLVQSDCICSALQLINFWQDVAVDWQKDRIYVPQTDLRQFRVGEADIAAGRWSANWAALMDFQIDRARDLMLQGAPLVHALPGRLGWEIRLTMQGGLRILERLRRVRGNVFAHRPKLGKWDWLVLAGRSLTM